MRPERAQAAAVELVLQGRDPLGEHAGFYGHAELAHAQVEEPLVRPLGPLIWRQHPVLDHPSSLMGLSHPIG